MFVCVVAFLDCFDLDVNVRFVEYGLVELEPVFSDLPVGAIPVDFCLERCQLRGKELPNPDTLKYSLKKAFSAGAEAQIMATWASTPVHAQAGWAAQVTSYVVK
jgi:hypothetical protein